MFYYINPESSDFSFFLLQKCLLLVTIIQCFDTLLYSYNNRFVNMIYLFLFVLLFFLAVFCKVMLQDLIIKIKCDLLQVHLYGVTQMHPLRTPTANILELFEIFKRLCVIFFLSYQNLLHISNMLCQVINMLACASKNLINLVICRNMKVNNND